MFAVVVTLTVKPDQIALFMPAMLNNAQTSLATEQGCQRFDVCTDPARPNEVFLYELYTDRAAFDAHLASDHYRAFDQITGPQVISKNVRTFTQVVS
ncbi:Quinol monooxygenase YgiN [Monaibacterium marinum]|uniref:Quinol monooxygenase YgiN n=1 Tax=Pontivivens marinum TaxID=1690039 RepID=A0A2C9CQP5_9RHOB|nr:putative quinol monooxygenase [Monaibacterium marinum]SOH93871.1 Quinol monooxygenase YgiN [Monaibacterium marinum]